MLVGYEDDQFTRVKRGMLKADFEELLRNETDWRGFLRLGYGWHISGNNRYTIKETMRREKPEVFKDMEYWHLTITQIYAGLTNWQVR